MSAFPSWPARHIPPGVDRLLALLAGGLHSLSFVYTQAWWLQMAMVGWLAWRVSRGTARHAAWLGMAFGTAWLAGSVWWLFISMHRYGNLPAWMAGAAVALLCLTLSLYLAAAFAVFARWRRGRPGADALFFAAVWLLAELARGQLFTGFPWVASGYAHVDSPWAVWAPWLGVYGVGAVAAGVSAWLVLLGAQAWRKGALGCAVLGGMLLLMHLTGPAAWTRPTGSLSVALLQGNVPQDQKFSMEHLPAALLWTRNELLGARADLVLAPETVIPLLPHQLPADYWEPLVSHFQAPGRHALMGLPLGSYEEGYTNSAAGVSLATRELPGGFYRYDKYHLVPFGEFIPTGFRWFTEMMNLPLGDFNRGPVPAPSFVVTSPQGTLERVAPNICYEDLFGEELAARFTAPVLPGTAPQGQPPTVLANISNIGWFGDTIAIDQHLHISRMRSLEFQRPMLRATNTGATAIIDHAGRVTHHMAPYTQGVLYGQVQGRDGITPFAWWAGRFGLWPLWLLAGAVVAGCLWCSRAPRP